MTLVGLNGLTCPRYLLSAAFGLLYIFYVTDSAIPGIVGQSWLLCRSQQQYNYDLAGGLTGGGGGWGGGGGGGGED